MPLVKRLLGGDLAVEWTERLIVREVDYIFKVTRLLSQTPLKVISKSVLSGLCKQRKLILLQVMQTQKAVEFITSRAQYPRGCMTRLSISPQFEIDNLSSEQLGG